MTPSICTQSSAADNQEEKEPKEDCLESLKMTSMVSKRRFIYSEDRMTPESEMTGLDDEGNLTKVGVRG